MTEDGESNELGESSGDSSDNEPDRIVLQASAQKWIWVLIGSLVIVTFGVGMALGASTSGVAKGIGIVAAVFFGFCAFVALRQILAPGSLTITHTSIAIISSGRLTSFELADCGPFSAWRDPSRGTVRVVFDHHPDDDTPVTRMNRQLTGSSRSLPETYGASAEELATLLEGVRLAALRSRDLDD